MYKLIFSCLFFVGFLSPLFSLPILDSSEESYRLSDDKDAQLALEELGIASLLQKMPEILDLNADIFDPRENEKKAFYGKDSKISLLGHLLAKTRKQFKKRGTPSECFWKYCV